MMPPYSFPRSAVDDGETVEAAAIWETTEETGFEIADAGPVLFTRSFHWVFEGRSYDQEK